MIFFEFDLGFIPKSNVSVRDTKVGKILVKVVNVEKMTLDIVTLKHGAYMD
jgi:hypothetical protein